MRAKWGAAILLALAHAGTAPLGAQTSELSVEVGGSRVVPPSEVAGGAAAFLVAGLRGGRFGLGGSGAWASLLVGRALDAETGGDFVSGEVGGALRHDLTAGFAAGLEARVFGFRVADPFAYQAGAVEATASVRYRRGALAARIAGVGGAGHSKVTLSTVVQRLRRRATVVEVLEDDLWRWGGTGEVLLGGAPVAAGLAGGVFRSAGGTYRSAGLRVVAGGARGALEARLDAWSTPHGGETTGGVAFYIPWGGWSARGVAGRPEPDPLLLAEPGRGAEGVLFGRRILGSDPDGRKRSALFVVEDEDPAGAHVRFRVDAPAGAGSVQLLGDFTLWRPVAMRAEGSTWTLELDVPAGTHHFGFLVDGSWYLPDDAPDAVPDEWGRTSATLIVDGGGGA
jgi:hypothetical protein